MGPHIIQNLKTNIKSGLIEWVIICISQENLSNVSGIVKVPIGDKKHSI